MKGKIMIFTAIAGGYLVRDFTTHYSLVKNSFERNLITFIGACFIIILFGIIDEIKLCINNKSIEKKSQITRKQIRCLDCDKKRMIEEFKNQRKEFFNSYFAQSSITMKTIK